MHSRPFMPSDRRRPALLPCADLARSFSVAVGDEFVLPHSSVGSRVASDDDVLSEGMLHVVPVAGVQSIQEHPMILSILNQIRCRVGVDIDEQADAAAQLPEHSLEHFVPTELVQPVMEAQI